MKIEKELTAKGYRIMKTDGTKEEMKEYAKQMREQGYAMQVVEYSTAVRGYHDFAVWGKRVAK